MFSSLPFLGIVVIRPRADVKRLMLSTSHFYPGQVILNPPHVTKKKTKLIEPSALDVCQDYDSDGW